MESHKLEVFYSDEKTKIAIDYTRKAMEVFYEGCKHHHLHRQLSRPDRESALEYTFEAADFNYEGMTKSDNR